MQMRLLWHGRLFALMAIGILSFPNYSCAGKATFQYPPDLVRVAKDNGCIPIDKIDSGQEGENMTPFIYGYAPGNPHESAVFWCKKEDNKASKFYLLIHLKDFKNELAECPNVVEWNISRPCNLSFYSDTNKALDGYLKYPPPKIPIPKGEKYKHNAIVNNCDDELVDYLYCYKGSWYVRQMD